MPFTDFAKASGRMVALFALNFIIGGVIGGFVLVWRLLVAAWYVPLTIYRLIVSSRAMEMWKTAAPPMENGIHGPMEKPPQAVFLPVFHPNPRTFWSGRKDSAGRTSTTARKLCLQG